MGEDLFLFVDGAAPRAALAYNRLTKDLREKTIWCNTADEALSVLVDYKDRIKLISMDHDLNEYIRGNSNRFDSGMEVVRWLENNPIECLFVAHGWNTYPNVEMVRRVIKSGGWGKYKRFGE